MIPATTWRLGYVRDVDGDTIRAVLQRHVPLAPGYVDTITSGHVDEHGEMVPDTVSLRLIILDTPERGRVGYREATAQAAAWLLEHADGLMADTYESGGWDRLLADVYPIGKRGETLTQHMLQAGWDIYWPRS